MLKVLCIVNGYLEENCYIIHNNKTALIVDPGSESEKIINEINNLHLIVVGILITHYHFDHIGALDEIKNKYTDAVVFDYKSKSDIEIDSFKFKKINNFGHTMDSCSFFFEKDNLMFTGDFVFYETIGNYEEENEIEMFMSLKEFIKLNDDIKLYPGHGQASTVGHEKEYNYYLRGI
jgi:glyoxylase-like metal-dependent hydrolase (beta-lactamase superfamily II)